MKFYGWRDENGELATFKSWAAAAALAAPYPDFFTDPDVQESFGDFYDFAALSDVFENRSQVVGTRSQGWYLNRTDFGGDSKSWRNMESWQTRATVMAGEQARGSTHPN
jgi:multiple sugar transport system substrate-binding protein